MAGTSSRLGQLPIRWRLTLWYVALLAAAMAVFSLALYNGLRYLLDEALDQSLRDQAALVRGVVTLDGGEPRVAAPQLLEPTDDDRFVRIYDARGAVLADTAAGEDDRPAYPPGVARALTGDRTVVWFDAGDDRLRLLSEPLVDDGATVGVLQVGSESDAHETLSFVRAVIVVATPLMLLFAAGGGVWLAGRALAPIDRITRTAAEIGDRDLTRRIGLQLPDDEVGRLARTFDAMLDRLEGAFSRQRQFTADAAHELRTPLTLMQSQVELALAQPRDPAADQVVLEALAADVERLTRLSATLLLLARGDARGIEPEIEPVDLPELLDLVAEQYRPLAEAAAVVLWLDTEPLALRTDRDLLVQVLVNLLDNALRHAPAGTRVTLGCRQTAQGARLWVADEGPGIAPEHLPHLFERFYRVEQGRDRQRGGAGLGLSICREIARALGGTIQALSEPGAGTTVEVWLPSG